MTDDAANRSLVEVRDELHAALDVWLREGAITNSTDVADVGVVCAAIRDLDQVIAAQAARGPAPPSFDVAAMHSIVWNAATDAGAATPVADAVAVAVVKALRAQR